MMGSGAARSGRLRTGFAIVAVVLVAASCSAADELFGNEVEDTISSEATLGTTADVGVGVGVEAADQDPAGPAGEQAEPERPSIWTRGDDGSMRPTSPHSTVNQVLAPGNGQGWTVVGSIFDYGTGTSLPVVWSADEPDSRDSWERVELQEPGASDTQATDARMTGATRADGLDVAVGRSGRGREVRPAVWVRSTGGEWRAVDRSQFDRGAPEWLSHVGVNESTGLVMAVGGQSDVKTQSKPIVWVSTDGEQWEAVEEFPASVEGKETLRALAVGPDTSVLTGQRSGSTTTAISYWSDDGRTWAEADVETPADGGRSWMGESTWFNDRFVAVGSVATGAVFRPASWISDDGKVWELQQTPFETLDDGRTINVGFGALRVTSTDSMLYAAAGSSFLQQLWQSQDGTNWSVLGDITKVRSQALSVSSIAAVDDLLLLSTGEPGVVIYGDKFEDAPLRDDMLPLPDQYPWVADISHDGVSWVAVGGSSVQLKAGGTRDNARLWRSTDGLDWEIAERLPETSTGPVAAITPSADGLVAVGTESVRSANAQKRFGRGLIWHYTASDWDELDASSVRDDTARIGLDEVAVAGDDVLAGGWRFVPTGDNSDALLIQSIDGGEPERVDIGSTGPDNELLVAVCGNKSGEAVAVVSAQQPDANQLSAVRRNPEREWSDAEWPPSPEGERAMVAECVHGADGFLAAGVSFTGGADSDVGLWRSNDGSSWERVDGPPDFSASNDQRVTSMAATEDGYLLAGSDESTGEVLPMVWYGSGDDWERVTINAAATMNGLEIGYANGTIVVTGYNDGAIQVYTTTLERLMAELER